MSVAFSLLISTASLDIASDSTCPRPGNGLRAQLGDELYELSLQPRRFHPLMVCDKIRHGASRMQSTQRLRKRLIVDRREVERCVELTGLHIVDEGLPIGCARISDTVTPDRIQLFRHMVGQATQVVVQFAVEVGL